MQTRHKILECILYLIKDLESDWQEELERINIWEDIQFIYNAPGMDRYIANITLAFTVLAYDNRSKWLNFHKDRYEDKKAILHRIAGDPAVRHEILLDVIYNRHKEGYDLSNWYLKYQKDWRWQMIITHIEFSSMAEKIAARGAIDAKDAIDIGKMIEIGKQRRQDADDMVDKLRKEFIALDTVLEKEGRVKISDIDEENFMSHEQWIKNRIKERDSKKNKV